jgi:hypothetical protein
MAPLSALQRKLSHQSKEKVKRVYHVTVLSATGMSKAIDKALFVFARGDHAFESSVAEQELGSFLFNERVSQQVTLFRNEDESFEPKEYKLCLHQAAAGAKRGAIFAGGKIGALVTCPTLHRRVLTLSSFQIWRAMRTRKQPSGWYSCWTRLRMPRVSANRSLLCLPSRRRGREREKRCRWKLSRLRKSRRSGLHPATRMTTRMTVRPNTEAGAHTPRRLCGTMAMRMWLRRRAITVSAQQKEQGPSRCLRRRRRCR